MLLLDVAPRTQQLPQRRIATPLRLAASAALHVAALMIAASIKPAPAPGFDLRRSEPITKEAKLDVRQIVFLAPDLRGIGGGGGGGGNQQPGPIRRAQGIGSDSITLRVRQPPPAAPPVTTDSPLPVEDMLTLPAVVLDARPLASGTFDQIGLPTGGAPSGTSTGPGSGGGIGTGSGTGIGSGRGPGLGPGSGGGIGGGVYRPGAAVTAPRVITEVKPTYTPHALLHKIQGTVVLELIVRRDGHPSQIRVVRSLDPEGLDEQAVGGSGAMAVRTRAARRDTGRRARHHRAGLLDSLTAHERRRLPVPPRAAGQ